VIAGQPWVACTARTIALYGNGNASDLQNCRSGVPRSASYCHAPIFMGGDNSEHIRVEDCLRERATPLHQRRTLLAALRLTLCPLTFLRLNFLPFLTFRPAL
jgi:hypothetical protein